ncbi:MAG: flagellin [Ruminococcaceae bacterium]|nr:flagellin [Oscillospiraceae bacterium]
MRIQHNISAMNSYRNFSANNSNLSKNLEKLSTGYKINRAGDDAAGLAISEKMRAQITGLEGATKNAKDGISLIQTAEGALTEVHSMLNRMTTLAEQSANGTYADEVDREQLQKEVDALKSEIDRIADSTNFNGLKLLDGSLSGGSNIKGSVTLSDTVATATVATLAVLEDTNVAGGDGKQLKEGDVISYKVDWKEDGVEKTQTLKFTVRYDEGENKSYMVAEDGSKYDMASTVSATVANLDKAITAEFKKNDELSAAFKIESTSADNGTFQLTSKTLGSKGATLLNVDATVTYGEKNTAANQGKTVNIGGSTITSNTAGQDVMQKLDFSNIKVLDSTKTNYTGRTLEEIVDENTFEIDGKKFVLYSADNAKKVQDLKNAAGSDVTFIQLDGANKAATNADYTTNDTETTGGLDAKTIAAELSRVTGREFTAAQVNTKGEVDNTSGNWEVLLKGDKLSKTGKALDLQIGDTADSFNKMSVKVADMHTKSIGIGDIDISNQTGAAEALDKIKAAINTVSDQRGSLGALQNRLDHTINNLGVMRENIQNAESTIRDTDIAEEMMAYTKNNILNQSAQAMLAQANQLPQGVLQLLG